MGVWRGSCPQWGAGPWSLQPAQTGPRGRKPATGAGRGVGSGRGLARLWPQHWLKTAFANPPTQTQPTTPQPLLRTEASAPLTRLLLPRPGPCRPPSTHLAAPPPVVVVGMMWGLGVTVSGCNLDMILVLCCKCSQIILDINDSPCSGATPVLFVWELNCQTHETEAFTSHTPLSERVCQPLACKAGRTAVLGGSRLRRTSKWRWLTQLNHSRKVADASTSSRSWQRRVRRRGRGRSSAPRAPGVSSRPIYSRPAGLTSLAETMFTCHLMVVSY